MKMHTAVDAQAGLIQSMVCTAANEADVVRGHELQHGRERQLQGDGGYTGLNKREEMQADCAKTSTGASPSSAA